MNDYQQAIAAAREAVMTIADSAPFPDIGERDAEEIANAAINAFLSKLFEAALNPSADT